MSWPRIKIKIILSLAFITTLALGMFLFSSDAEAVQIKQVQTGEVYFDADDISMPVTIAKVSQTKSIVLLYINSDTTGTAASQNILYTAQFGSDTDLIISRDGATYGGIVRFYVIEFVDGVTVQRGLSSFAAGNPSQSKYTSKDIELTTALGDYTHAVPIIQVRSGVTVSTADEITTIKATIFNDGKDKLKLERYASNDALKTVNIVWQVAEFTRDANIKIGTATMTNNEATGTKVWNDSAVDLTKSFLFFTYRADRDVNGIEGLYKLRGEISTGVGTTTATFTRGAKTGAGLTGIDIQCYVVELTDLLTTVQAENVALANGDEVKLKSVNPALDPLRTVPFVSVSGPLNDTTINTKDDELNFSVQTDAIKGLYYMDYDATHRYIWFCDTYAGTVGAYNTATGAKVVFSVDSQDHIHVGTMPVAICYLPVATYESIWVVNYGSANVTRINPTTGAIIETVAVQNYPVDIAVDTFAASPGSIWTANFGSSTVTRITPSTVAAPPSAVVGSYATRTGPTALCHLPVNDASVPARQYMWVLYANDTRISKVRITTGAVTSYDMMVSAGFSSIRYAPSGYGGRNYPQLWATNVRNNYVTVVNLTDQTAPVKVLEYGTGMNPRALVIQDDAEEALWITNYGSDELIKMNPADGTLSFTKSTGRNPWGLTLDTNLNKVWVSHVTEQAMRTYAKANAAPDTPITIRTTLGNMYLTRNNSGTSADITAPCRVTQFCPITLIQPNGSADIWQVSGAPTITWKYSDALSGDLVRVQINKGGGAWEDITGADNLDIGNGGVANQGSFTWTNLPASLGGITNFIGTTLSVRVIDKTKDTYPPTNYYDEANANFKIKGKLTLTLPTSSSSWTIFKTGDTAPQVKWNTNGNLNDAALIPHDMTIFLAIDGTNFTHTLLNTDQSEAIHVDPGTDGSNNNPWTWQIPSTVHLDGSGTPGTFDNPIGSTNKIKIIHNYAAAGTMESISDPFTIKGQIFEVALTKPDDSPLDGNTCTLGETYKIAWKKIGHFGSGLAEGTVKIWYASDGVTYTTELTPDVVPTPPSAGTDSNGTTWSGSCAWTPTSVSLKSQNAKIKVVQSGGAQVSGEMGSTFKVAGGSIVVGAPAGEATWKVGETKAITWTPTGSFTNVDILLSRNNGGTWDALGTVAKTATPKDWVVGKNFAGTVLSGTLASAQCLIKVVASTDADVYDLSGNGANGTPFTIEGAITNVKYYDVTPAAWEVGKACAIYWTGTSTLGNVDIQLSANNGGTYTSILGVAENIPVTQASYTAWIVRPPLTTAENKAMIKVVSKTYTSISNTSGTFDITGGFNISVPGDTTSCEVGEACDITWTTVGTISPVAISLSTNSGGTWATIAPSVVNDTSPKTYSLWLPTAAQLASNTAKIKIEGTVEGQGVSSLAPSGTNNFDIVGGFNISVPGDTTSCEVGEACDITWTTIGTISPVTISLSTNSGGTWATIAPDIVNDTSPKTYSLWLPTAAQLASNTAKIKIEGQGVSSLAPSGTDYFDITGGFNISVPGDTTTCEVGEACDITWTTIGTISPVAISLSTNSGGTWTTIAPSVVNDTSPKTYSGWLPTAAQLASNTAKIKIEKVGGGLAAVGPADPNYFDIAGGFTISKPGNGENWEVGKAGNVEWGTTGTVSTVTISLSRNNGGSWTSIATDETNDGKFDTWIVDTPLTADAKIKIEGAGLTAIAPAAPNKFNIIGSINVNQPANWKVGNNCSVSWTTVGTFNNVDVWLSRNNGAVGSWVLIGPGIANTGSFSGWQVLPPLSNNLALVKVQSTDAGTSSIYGVCAANFSIQASINVVKPDANTDFWEIGTDQYIVWTYDGSFGNVNIELSRNNGAPGSWSNLNTQAIPVNNQPEGNLFSGASYWKWTPVSAPATIGKLGLIRIKSDSYPNDIVSSNSPTFEVRQSIIVDVPTGTGIVWKTRESRDIEYTLLGGSVTTIDILYDKGAGPVAITPGAGVLVSAYPDSYPWSSIPDAAIGESVKIRVRDHARPTAVYGDSINPFKIKAVVQVSGISLNELVQVTDPSPGENNIKNITWSVLGSASGNVDIKLLKQGSWTDLSINTIDINSTQGYPWTVLAANVDGTQLKVGLHGDDDPDTGTAGVTPVFKVVPYLKLTYPPTTGVVSGSPFNVFDHIYIKWIPNPADLGQVTLAYDTNDGLGADGLPGTDDYNNDIITVASNHKHNGTDIGEDWQIPDATGIVSDKIRIKVYKVGKKDEVFSTSTKFTVKGTIVITGEANGDLVGEPPAQPVWKIGQAPSPVITWTVVGDIGDVSINYDLGDQTFGGVVIGSTSSSPPQYSWPIPADVLGNTSADADWNNQVKFRISSINPAGITADSASPITIRKQYVNVKVPLSDLYVGDNETAKSNITWTTKGNVTKDVTIRYDTNNEGNFTGIVVPDASPISDAAGKLWDVPAAAMGSNVRVRVRSISYPQYVYGDSGYFTVWGKIVPGPMPLANGSSILKVNNALPNITYSKYGSIGNMKIEYIHQGAENPNTTLIVPNTDYPNGATTTSFPWTMIHKDSNNENVIDIGGVSPTKNSKFKFTSLGTQPPGSVNAEVEFRVKGEIYEVKPTGGFVSVGQTKAIEWKTRGDVAPVCIKLDLDNAGTYAHDVIAPDGQTTGESVGYSASYIYDSDTGIGTGTWQWKVLPTPDLTTKTARIRVESLANPESLTDGMDTYGVSSASFEIKGSIDSITSPTAAPPYWKVGETGHSIAWTASGTVGDVSITLYDTDATPQSYPITSDNNNVNPFSNWSIPVGFTTDSAKITITSIDPTKPTVTLDSEVFKIKPVIDLTYPNGDVGETEVVVGTTCYINWNAPVGDAANFKINVSTDGETWNDGARTLGNKGGLINGQWSSGTKPFEWLVDDIMTKTAKIRIQKVGDTDAYDTSQATFYIKGSISNVQVKDVGGVPINDLPINIDAYISWGHAGTFGTVDISYATDANLLYDGKPDTNPDWKPIPDFDGAGTDYISGTGVNENAVSFKWRIPAAPSASVAVKVTSNNDPARDWQQVYGLSCSGLPSLKRIIGSISNVTVADDGPPLNTAMEVGGKKTIQWLPLPAGTMTTFNVEYRYKNAQDNWVPPGGAFTEIANNITPGQGAGDYRTWEWPSVLDTISKNVQFRVLYYGDTGVKDISPEGYIIKGKLTMVTPDDEAAPWGLGEPKTITWNKHGTIGPLLIELSTSGTFEAADYTAGYVFTIKDDQSPDSNPDGNGNNNLSWAAGIITVGGAQRKISNDCRVQINTKSAPTGCELSAVSTNKFQIIPTILDLTSPPPPSGEPPTPVTWNRVAAGDPATNKISWTTNSGTDKAGNLATVQIAYIISSVPTPITGAQALTVPNNASISNDYNWTVADEKTDDTHLATIEVSYNNFTGDATRKTSWVSPEFKILPMIVVDDANITSKAPLIALDADGEGNFVKWSYTGTKINTVNIFYDKDYSGTFSPDGNIGLGVDNDENAGVGVKWDGPLPDTSDAVRVRVVDTGNSEVTDDSISFKIIGGLTLNAPKSQTTTWTALDTTKKVNWNFSGTIPAVNIYYDYNGGLGGYNNNTPLDTVTQTGPSGTNKTWDWPALPSYVTNNAVIKITDAAHENEVFVVSDPAFKIGAKFDITNPESSGHIAKIGQTYTVNWNNYNLTGVTKVKIYYKNNYPSGNWVEIDQGVTKANLGYYTWTANALPGTYEDLNDVANRIMITQFEPENEANAFDFSVGNFPIYGKLEVTVPSAATNPWEVNTLQTIKFKKKGEIRSVDIYYAPDGLTYGENPINASPVDISGPPDGNGEYSHDWNKIPLGTPLTQGKSGKIKVRAVDPALQDNSSVDGISAGFQIKGSIVLVHPDSGETMEVGGSKDIVWTPTGTISKYKIEYKCTGGTVCTGDWQEISPAPGTTGADDEQGHLKWPWTNIPDAISNQVLFRVSDYDNSDVKAESSNYNFIKGKLTLVTPDAEAAPWGLGEGKTITWNKHGSIGPLLIELSTSGTFTQSDRTSGYVFTIKDDQSPDSNPDGNGNNNLSWSAGIITVGGAQRKISNDCSVQINTKSAPSGCELSAVSTNKFQIVPTILDLTSPPPPSGGPPPVPVTWNRVADGDPTKKTISWTTNSGTDKAGNLATVQIAYIISSVPTPITGAQALTVPNNASISNDYNWTVADEKTDDTHLATIEVSYNNFTGDATRKTSWVSPEFKILPMIVVDDANITSKAPLIALDADGEGNFVKWSYTGTKINTVNIFYDKDYSGTFSPDGNIGLGVDNDENAGVGVKWDGPLPDTSDAVRVRVVDTGNSEVTDDSISFKIIGGLTLNAPKSQTTTWTALDTTKKVNWNFSGTIPAVNIYYDYNGGLGGYNNNTPLDTVTQTGPSGTNKTWDWPALPSYVTNNAVIKITDAAHENEVFVVSDPAFKIGAKFDITNPESSGHIAKIGQTYTVNWNNYNLTGVTKVKIYYKNNYPSGNWVEIDQGVTKANLGYYTWTANALPGTYEDLNDVANRIMITQFEPENEANAFDFSVGNFPIYGKLEVTVPSAATNPWEVNTLQTIKFKKKGEIRSVDIYYAPDGLTYGENPINASPVDISGPPDGNGEYSHDWNKIPLGTPLTQGKSGKIKVRAVDPALQDNSSVDGISAGFQIKGSIVLVHPDSGETMEVGGSKDIVWTPTGTISKYKIEYKCTGGTVCTGDWQEISPAPGTTGADDEQGHLKWPWTNIPDAISNQVLFRVSDYDNSNVKAESSNYNFIKGQLTLVSPQTGHYNIGGPVTISWNKKGSIGDLTIEYSAKGDFSDTEGIDNAYDSGTGDGTFSRSPDWTASDAYVSETCKIRISNNTSIPELKLTRQTTGSFGIRPYITNISAPSSGQTYNVGVQNPINWSAVSAVKTDGSSYPQVKLQYNVEGGSFKNISGAGSLNCYNGGAGDGNTFNWPVSDEKNDEIKIKITFTEYPEAANEYFIYPNTFQIMPKITVTIGDPDGRLPVGSYVGLPEARLIKWSTNGSEKVDNVDVLYDLYNGAGPTPDPGDEYLGQIAPSQPVGSGTDGIFWYNDGKGVPNTMTPQSTLKIKVVDSAEPAVYGVSTGLLKIVGALTLDKPAAGGTRDEKLTNGEYLKTGNSFTIKWTKKGDGLTRVALKYSVDGGDFNSIFPLTEPPTLYIDAGGTGGEYPWTIPNTTSDQVIVRIIDYADDVTKSESPEIHIQSKLEITSPLNGAVWAAGDSHPVNWKISGKTRYVKLQYCTKSACTENDWTTIDSLDNGDNSWGVPPAWATFSYDWNNIPVAAISNSYASVRVVDNADVENWYQGSAFRIRPSITVVSPNGNPREEWPIGSTQLIKWSIKDKDEKDPEDLKVDAVDLLYAVGGPPYNYVYMQYGDPLQDAKNISPTDGLAGWSWHIPDDVDVSSHVRVQVVDSGDITVVDTSDLDFSLQGQINFVGDVPASDDEVWFVGEEKSVSCTTLGTIPAIKMEYCKGSCGNPNNYHAIPGAGNFTCSAGTCDAVFDVPDAVGPSVSIRAVSADADKPAVAAVSNNPLEIADTIYIDAPVNEPRWGIGTTPQIKWHTTGSLANVKIEYSLDGTVQPPGNIVWHDVVVPNSTPSNSGGTIKTKNWYIPTDTTTTVKAVIRISDAAAGTGTIPVVSNTFRIVGSFFFDSPTSTSNWPVTQGGIQHTPQDTKIQWHTQGVIPLVDLYYSYIEGHAPETFSGNKINTTPIEIQGTNGSYDWTVPDHISKFVQIRIEDNADPYVDADHLGTSVLSDEFIIRGDIQLTAPLGGTDTWKVDTVAPATITKHRISWKYNGSIGPVHLYYSLGGCNGSTEQINGDISYISGYYDWQIPVDAMTTTACVMIENLQASPLHIQDDSGSSFKIVARLDITDPDGSETVLAGENYEIKWNKWGDACNFVKIELSTDGSTFTKVIADGDQAPNTGSFTWLKNASVKASDNVTNTALIRISDVNDSSDLPSKTISANTFFIKAHLTLNPVTSPVGGLEVGQQYDVIWLKDGNIPWVLLQYSTDGFNNDQRNIVSNIDDDTCTAEDSNCDPQDPGFVPSEHWVSNAGIPGDPTRAKFPWTVADIINVADIKGVHLIGADQVSLRVSDPYNQSSENFSNTFKIIPKFTVTYPNGNADPDLTQKLKVGAVPVPYEITWNSTSTQAHTPNVKIIYGPPYDNVITYSTANDGSYPWVSGNGGVPNYISPEVKIRIEDATDRALIAYDESNENFKIISNFTLNTPNDGGALGYYEVGDPWTISWSNKGTVNNVDIAYDTYDGKGYDGIEGNVDDCWNMGADGVPGGTGANADYLNVIASSLVNNPDPVNGGGTYNSGTVPNAISYDVRVRVRSATDEGYDISDNKFRIRGRIEDVAVNNGDPVPIHGIDIPITWTAYGTIPNVDILYDTYGGSGYDGIEGNADDYWNMGADGVPGGTGANADYLNVIADNLANCTPVAPAVSCNNTTFKWQNVPDNPTALGKVKIFDSRTSPDNTDVKGISSGNFNIVGNFTIVAPNGNEDWKVNTPHNIIWRWGGTIPKVKLFYTKNQAADPSTIPDGDWIVIDAEEDYSTDGKGNGSGNAERSYPWTIPNDIAPKVRVKVQDFNDPTVKDYSDNFFKIRGTLTLTSPVGNVDPTKSERWVTNEKHNISWITAGSIPFVELQYSNDDFVSDINEIILAEPYTKQNCLPVAPELTCTKSHEWTIPDDVLKDKDYKYKDPNLVKVRVFDINDPPTVNGPGVSYTSDNFKIDYYQMTWKLYDLSTSEPLSNLTYTEKITGTDIVNRTGGGLASKPSIILPTTYGTWTTTWVTTGYGEKAQNFVANSNQSFTLFLETTVIHIWRAASEFAYKPATITPAAPDNLSISSWLERDGVVVSGATIPDVYIYDGLSLIKRLTAVKNKNDPAAGQTTIYYYQNIPEGAVELWIGERDDGSVRTTADVIADIAALGPSYKISQETVSENSFAGFFKQTWTNTPLASGKVYNIITDMMNASGAHFRTPGSFEITAAKSLQEMYAKVNSVLDKPISEVRTDLLSVLNAQTTAINTAVATQTKTINDAMETQTGLIDQRTTDMKSTIDTTMASFAETTKESLDLLASGAQQAVEAGQKLEETALKYSWKASVSPNPALVNDMITLQCQGQPGKTPFLTIYSWDNKYIIREQVLTESATPGLYIYEFMADSRFTPGKSYTYMVTESDTNGMVSGSGMVESMSLTTIAGLASAAPEAERAAKNALDAIKAVEAVITSADNVNVALTLRNLKDSVEALPEVLSKEGPSARISEAVNELSTKLNKLIGGEGYDLSSLLEEALSSSPTIKEIRGKADTINAIIDILLQIVEGKLGGVDTPIVSTSLAPGSVRFRIIALNPSKIKTQRVQVKNYLPIEVKPKNIADLGGLELDYDSAKSIYYLYKPDLELAPAEVRIFEVEVEDIWMVPEHKLADLRKRTNEILTRLEKTEHYAQAKDIANTIYPRLDEIAKSQVDEAVSREQHIGIYRQNLLTIKQIEEDIDKLEKILRPQAGAPIPEILEKARLKLNLPSKSATWLIILMIIVFLGLLAGVFFFVWQAQVRSSQDILKGAKDSAFPEEKPKEKKSEDKPSTEEKK